MGKPPTLTAAEKRSRTMSRIRSKDTSIELALRRALWHAGIRYRKNYKKLPGTPDIAITKHHIAIFCDGEFWHGKDWDEKKHRIKSNNAFWTDKIERNISRDCETDRQLRIRDWTVLRFWGDEIRDDLEACVDEIKHVIQQREFEAGGAYVEGAHEGDGSSGSSSGDLGAVDWVPRGD